MARAGRAAADAAGREQAHQDRSASALARSQAAPDRSSAGQSTAHTADWTAANEHDREAASGERATGDGARTDAVLDRRLALDIRDHPAAGRRVSLPR